MDTSFLWHDYETFGADPRHDRPAQFAAVRTDAQLNETGQSINLSCQLAADCLPDPQACLITGITPQDCQSGLSEHAFAAQIHAALSAAGTVGVGYNSIRFDDEFTRHLFWRNLIDPYGREWQNGCGRWDLLDVLRLAHALRPQGLQWPQRPDGFTSFRLEDMAAANGIAHEAAHDALCDVRATLALARLLRAAQPKLFDFALSLRRKERVAAELGLPAEQSQARPFLHVSGMLGAQHGHLAIMWPLASHPLNRNEVIAWDLRHDPAELATLDAAAIGARLFTAAADLPPGVARLPIKTIHLNKSPMLVRRLDVLTPEMALRWDIDTAQACRHALNARALPDMSAIWQQVFERPAVDPDAAPDADAALYGGFISNEDRRRLERLRKLSPEQLPHEPSGFDDPRLPEVFWRWRARNFAHTLDAQQQQRWKAHCSARLLGQSVQGVRNAEAFFAQNHALRASCAGDERALRILHALEEDAQNRLSALR